MAQSNRSYTTTYSSTIVSIALTPVLPHPAVLVGDFNSHHPDWGYHGALNSDYLLLHDAKQRGMFHSAGWQRDYSPDLCWISTTDGRPQPASSVVLGENW